MRSERCLAATFIQFRIVIVCSTNEGIVFFDRILIERVIRPLVVLGKNPPAARAFIDAVRKNIFAAERRTLAFGGLEFALGEIRFGTNMVTGIAFVLECIGHVTSAEGAGASLVVAMQLSMRLHFFL